MRIGSHSSLFTALMALGALLASCGSPPPATSAKAGPLESLAIPAGENPMRWAEDMERFAAEDASAEHAPGKVVFVGSSSIRLWKTLSRDMDGVAVVQRGFGGSRLFDACYWSERLVSVHDPGLVVVFSGTNDIAGDAPKSGEEVRDLFRLFVERARHGRPELRLIYIAITPTPARARHLGIVRRANELIAADCEADARLAFIDPSGDLTTSSGAPDPRWFLGDGLHLNAEGYAVWTRHIRPLVEAWAPQ